VHIDLLVTRTFIGVFNTRGCGRRKLLSRITFAVMSLFLFLSSGKCSRRGIGEACNSRISPSSDTDRGRRGKFAICSSSVFRARQERGRGLRKDFAWTDRRAGSARSSGQARGRRRDSLLKRRALKTTMSLHFNDLFFGSALPFKSVRLQVCGPRSRGPLPRRGDP